MHPNYRGIITGAAMSTVVACGDADRKTATTDQPPPPATTAASESQLLALGDSIFHGTAAGGICYTCHGPDAKGTQLAPNLTDQTWINGDGSLPFITSTVSNGVPAPKQHPSPMPAFTGILTEAQINAVARYAYSLSHPKG